MSAPGFWDKPETAQEVGRKRARVEKRIASGLSSAETLTLIELLEKVHSSARSL